MWQRQGRFDRDDWRKLLALGILTAVTSKRSLEHKAVSGALLLLRYWL